MGVFIKIPFSENISDNWGGFRIGVFFRGYAFFELSSKIIHRLLSQELFGMHEVFVGIADMTCASK